MQGIPLYAENSGVLEDGSDDCRRFLFSQRHFFHEGAGRGALLLRWGVSRDVQAECDELGGERRISLVVTVDFFSRKFHRDIGDGTDAGFGKNSVDTCEGLRDGWLNALRDCCQSAEADVVAIAVFDQSNCGRESSPEHNLISLLRARLSSRSVSNGPVVVTMSLTSRRDSDARRERAHTSENSQSHQLLLSVDGAGVSGVSYDFTATAE
mmetsp:Transcript_3974/g.12987  ORF Transcript_3974/g.12987 Transcript_3974/m.12987 type:complete len:210 (-) Transcript_3974:5416-6045(-)